MATIKISGLAKPHTSQAATVIKAMIVSFGKAGAQSRCNFADSTGSALIQIEGDQESIPRDWMRSLTKIANISESCNLTYQRSDDPHYKPTLKKSHFLDLPEMAEECNGYSWHDPFHKGQ